MAEVATVPLLGPLQAAHSSASRASSSCCPLSFCEHNPQEKLLSQAE